MSIKSIPAPLPRLGPATTYPQEFDMAGQLIATAKTAFVNRAEPYQRSLDDKFVELGLSLGLSATTACRKLADGDSLWCCVCARPYLEFSLRLLWALREPNGVARMYSYYSRLHREWWEKLAKHNPEYKSMLDEMDAAAPLSKLPDPKMPDMRQLIEQIGKKDAAEGVPTLYADASDYDETVGFLHNFLHANPLMHGDGAEENLAHAAHAIRNATNALLRAVGYRLNWDQSTVVLAVIGISSLQSLSEAERETFRKSVK